MQPTDEAFLLTLLTDLLGAGEESDFPPYVQEMPALSVARTGPMRPLPLARQHGTSSDLCVAGALVPFESQNPSSEGLFFSRPT